MEKITPTEKELEEWEAWLSDPEHAVVAEVARRLPPWKLYYLKSAPPQRVMINSYHNVLEDSEHHKEGDVVVNVNVGSYFNFVVVERNIFDVPWQDLEECDDWRPWQEQAGWQGRKENYTI